MNPKDLLKTIISDNQARSLPVIWPRTLKIPIDSGKIITLAGVRRSGKTYHLLNLMKKLKEEGVPSQQFLYLNFEDERLKLTTEDLDLILQAYRELYPNLDISKCYFFFDEIQEVVGWEKFIDRLYHSISKHIFITGSNSTLLSREIATALRGRTITFEIYPLSFKEFVDINSGNLNPLLSTDKAKLINLFEQFLCQGGFPELVNCDKELQNKILQEYFNVMVLRDLIERYKITQVEILKYFCKRVVGNSAGEFSVHKIYNELKSQGYKISKDTIYAYQEYVEAIYLARFIPKYAHSVIKSELSQKKSYVIDQGMGVAMDFKLSQDKGRLLETTVGLELIKEGRQIAYTQNGTECDFVAIERGKVTEAIQVAYDLTDLETRNREIKGLVQTCKNFSITQGTIVTMDQEDNFEIDDINISIVSAWKYFFA
jgi:predicted AAA+ superfamily ATPase